MADGQVVYEIRGDDTLLNTDLALAEGKMRSRGATWKAIGRAALSATVLAAGAVVSFGKSAVQAGAAFDTSMSQVAATMGLTQEEIEATGGSFEKLRDAAKKYGSETAFSATQCADALNFMALAGYDADTSISMLPNVLSLAAAGSMELAQASDMITDSSSALGLSLDQTRVMVDQMAKASSKSNTSVTQLGEAILNIGGVARFMRGGTTELNTVLGVLADNGIKGSTAGIHLRNVLTQLSKSEGKTASELRALGVEVFDAEGKMRSFSQIFPELSAAMEGFTDQQKLDAFDKLFGVRDLATANALLNTSVERWEELSAAIDDSAGAAERMAATQLDNLNGDVTIFKSALEGLQIQLSDALTPTLREFVQFGTESLTRLTEAFNEGGLKGALTALGSVLSDAINMIVSYLPDMIEAGVGLLGALATGLINNLPEMLTAALGAIQTFALGLAEAYPELIPTIVEIVLQIVETLIDNLDLLIDAAVELIIALAEGLINALPILIEKGPVIIDKLVDALIRLAPELLKAAWEIIKAIAAGMMNNTPRVLAAGTSLLKQLLSSLVGGSGAFSGVGSAIVSGIGSGLTSSWGWLTSKVSSLAKSLLNSAKRALHINSPSTDFKEEVSGNIVKGLVAGLDDYGVDAVKATRRVTHEMLSAADVSVRAGVDTSGLYSALDSAAGISASVYASHAPVIIHNELSGSVDVDGFRLGKIMLQNLDDAAAYALPD